MCVCVCVCVCVNAPTFLIGGGGGGGAMVCLCSPTFTPHFYFSLELFVYLRLTNNYLAFFIYQLLSCGQFQ